MTYTPIGGGWFPVPEVIPWKIRTPVKATRSRIVGLYHAGMGSSTLAALVTIPPWALFLTGLSSLLCAVAVLLHLRSERKSRR